MSAKARLEPERDRTKQLDQAFEHEEKRADAKERQQETMAFDDHEKPGVCSH